MVVDRNKIWSAFEALPKTEQEVLVVLSVIYEPVNQTDLVRSLRQLGYQGAAIVGKSWRERMFARHLLEVTNGKLQCHPSIVNTLTYIATRDDTFERVSATNNDSMNRYLGSHWYDNEFHYNPWRYKRRLRNALFEYDEKVFLAQLDISSPYAKPTEERAHLLTTVAFPLEEEWFHSLPEPFRFQLLRYYLNQHTLLLKNIDNGVELLKESYARNGLTHPESMALLAEQTLYRKDWKAFEAQLPDTDTYSFLRLRAVQAFMQAGYEVAFTLFQRALAAKKKQEKKRVTHIDGIPGIFYCLLLVKMGSADTIKLLANQVAAASRKTVEEPLAWTYWLLQTFRDIWDGRELDATVLEAFDYSLDRRYPLEVHMLALTRYWLDMPLPPALVEHLQRIIESARLASFPWQADDVALLIETVQQENSAGGGLADMMPRLESWERALDALVQIAPSTKDKTEPRATNDEPRLIWILKRDQGMFTLEPWEQKKKKKGGWTRGRTVSLKRLAEASASMDHLLPEDHAICRRIRRSSYYGQRGYYLDSSALAAAGGHPLVFREDDLSNPLPINNRAPELIVKEAEGQVSIAMYPDPIADEDDDDDDYERAVNAPSYHIVEGAGAIDIYEFDDRLKQIAGILDGGLKVPSSAKERVVQSIVAVSPLLTVHSDLAGIGQGPSESVPADPRLYLNMQPRGDELKLNIAVQPFGKGPRFLPGSGGETVFAEIDGKPMQAVRNLDGERALQEEIHTRCSGLVHQGEGTWSFLDVEQTLEGLLALQQMDDQLVFSWPEGKGIKLHREVGTSSVSMSIRSRTNWFEVAGEVVLDASDVLDMQKLLALLESSPGRFVRLGDNEFVALTQELRDRLSRLQAITNDGRISKIAGFHLDEVGDGMVLTADKKWREFTSRLEQARDFEPVLPTTLAAELRDYQIDGYRWLARLAAWGAGACLADDMGLGKTLQSLALMLSRAPGGPGLVIAPTSVCMNWLDEIDRFAPTLNPILFGIGDRAQMLDDLAPFDVVICSYGLLASESTMLTDIDWCTIVADEAQAFKNANTLRSKSVMKLSGDCRIITTGTPIENHLGEFWNLFQFINPGLLGSLRHFNENFARPIENGDDQARQNLKQMISPFVLRRLKRDVLAELPPRTDITLSVILSKEEIALYEALRQEAVSSVLAEGADNRRRMIVLAHITRLRQMACHPALVMPDAGIGSSKLEAFAKLVSELLENRHKVLVFSQFVTHLTLIREYLDGQGIDYQYLDGSTRPAARKRAVTAFQAGDGDLFLISLKAGGLGLNLTAANYVIHLDPWWNPAAEDQASDRAHRIGQQRPVTVYRLVAEDTIEQKIVELHQHKRELADSLLDGTDIGARMSLDEIVALLGR